MTESEKLIKKLVEEYGYKPIPPMFASGYREVYKADIPAYLSIDGSCDTLCDAAGALICSGYTRIVIGDYGAFVEFSETQAHSENFIVAPGQEYRINDTRYSGNVKYHWLTSVSGSGVKIYHQIKTVPYADYLDGMYYISPFEVTITEI